MKLQCLRLQDICHLLLMNYMQKVCNNATGNQICRAVWVKPCDFCNQLHHSVSRFGLSRVIFAINCTTMFPGFAN
ncbi:hypothetical protein BRADI_1g78713v3 [Brachypodium distachyon]|uniref:Uncharacterized protein n=1 Tax=Brachypodium distachyon TaxID=15368 RepID=A0A0Q3HN36_BRADI|nr:hypothetical protein BRADI_1g78713v3 [Brachypodium distachyon]